MNKFPMKFANLSKTLNVESLTEGEHFQILCIDILQDDICALYQKMLYIILLGILNNDMPHAGKLKEIHLLVITYGYC